jgi:HPt (histidine-containing phosphotransfer) domain-containing protein
VAGDDVEFARELLTVFITDTRENLLQVRCTLDQGEGLSSARIAHAIKGAAANVGALSIQRKAQCLEDAIRRNDTEAITGAEELIATAIEVTIAELKKLGYDIE